MRAFFLTGSIIFTVIILILAFQNLAASVSGFAFLFAEATSGFFIVLSLAGLGVIAGIFYTCLVTALLKSGSEEEEAPGGEW